MTFFDILRNLFFTKQDTSSLLDTETQTQFTPFIINRWLSFYSREQCVFVNETINKYTGLFEDKSDLHSLYFNLIPKLKFKKIGYIKKKKEDKEKIDDNHITVLSKNNNISKREIQQYIDLFTTVDK